MAKKRIELISVAVADQDRALEFYRDKLGFTVTEDNQFPGEDGTMQRWLELAASPDAETSIALLTWFPNMPPGSLQGAILWVEDIEVARNALIEQEVEVEAIVETPWGKFAGFNDPDGIGWSLHGE